MTRLLCTHTARCSYHEDGGDKRAKCPGACDARGCREPEADDGLCDRHAAMRARGPGRPRTGSAGTRVVSFRLGAAEHAAATRAAQSANVTVGELAKRKLIKPRKGA